MGAFIRILTDDSVVTETESRDLAQNMRKIVVKAVTEEDVFVYLDPSKAILADPIEVFIQVNAAKTADSQELLNAIALEISSWKSNNNFKQPVNINVIPVEWYAKIGV